MTASETPVILDLLARWRKNVKVHLLDGTKHLAPAAHVAAVVSAGGKWAYAQERKRLRVYEIETAEPIAQRANETPAGLFEPCWRNTESSCKWWWGDQRTTGDSKTAAALESLSQSRPPNRPPRNWWDSIRDREPIPAPGHTTVLQSVGAKLRMFCLIRIDGQSSGVNVITELDKAPDWMRLTRRSQGLNGDRRANRYFAVWPDGYPGQAQAIKAHRTAQY